MKKVLVTAAVRQELSGLEKTLEDSEPLPGESGCYLRGTLAGTEVLLGLTGIGAGRAGEKIGLFLDAESPELLLATGFGGGLRGTLRSGDIILAERVVQASGDREDPGELGVDETLLDTLGTISLPSAAVSRGSLLTVEDVVCSAKQKLALGSRYGADGVDMESYVILSEALKREVPCIAARVVFDEAAFELPPGLDGITAANGRLSAGRLAALLLRRPWSIPGLLALRSRSVLASGALAVFVKEAVLAWKDSGQDD